MQRNKKFADTLPKLLDVVEIVKARPDLKIVEGSIGTVVEALGENAYLVEFLDKDGKTIAVEAVPAGDLSLHR
jgi:hypothetical protein